jgi:hypothetical protein
MLMAQPPITELRLMKRVHAITGDYENTCVIMCLEGVRMGLLYDVVEEWCAEEAAHSFAGRWDKVGWCGGAGGTAVGNGEGEAEEGEGDAVLSIV